MLYLKACPNCSGDIYRNWDIYGHYYECLQCGRIWEFQVQRSTPEESETVAPVPTASGV